MCKHFREQARIIGGCVCIPCHYLYISDMFCSITKWFQHFISGTLFMIRLSCRVGRCAFRVYGAALPWASQASLAHLAHCHLPWLASPLQGLRLRSCPAPSTGTFLGRRSQGWTVASCALWLFPPKAMTYSRCLGAKDVLCWPPVSLLDPWRFFWIWDQGLEPWCHRSQAPVSSLKWVRLDLCSAYTLPYVNIPHAVGHAWMYCPPALACLLVKLGCQWKCGQHIWSITRHVQNAYLGKGSPCGLYKSYQNYEEKKVVSWQQSYY